MQLQERFSRNWETKKFATPEQTILLAVSGGADSMVMADLFLKAGLPFAIAHCNFQLRGAEADKDEDLVREWAAQNSIPFYHIRFDTRQKCEEWKKGIQETARILRYEWLDGIRLENKYHRIATAHHANDNVETLLINLFKGTGIAGMHGIQEHTGKLIRPLLFATKEELLQYAADTQVPYRNDASNDKDDYLRNAVRHHLIPVAEKFFPGAVTQVSETIERLAEAEIIYKRGIEQERKKLMEQRGKDHYIPLLKLRHRQPLQTICYELLHPFGFTSAQVPHVVRLMEAESGHYISSATHKVIKNRDFFIITPITPAESGHVLVEGFPCTIRTEGKELKFSLEKKPDQLSPDTSVAYIDARRIALPLVLRKWHKGDYFYPLGMGMKKKKVSKYFIDTKVPLHEKDKVWVLEVQKRIAWLAGMRLDDRFKVTDSTQKVLKITVKDL